MNTVPQLLPKSQLRQVSIVSKAKALIKDNGPSTLPSPRINPRPIATVSQLPYPACVGAACTNALNQLYRERKFDEAFALDLWREARDHDKDPNNNNDGSGTWVWAAAKILKKRGLISDFKFTYYEIEARRWVLSEGSLVLSIPWYETMDHPDPDGRLEVSEEIIGGHAILANWNYQKLQEWDLQQSWPGYPPYDVFNQHVRVSNVNMKKLFRNGGNAYLFVR